MKRMINSDDIVELTDVVAEVKGLDAKADKLYATNLITNGNFASLDGWACGYGSLSVSNNVATILGNVANNYADIEKYFTNFIVGHKYLFKCQVRVLQTTYQVAFHSLNDFNAILNPTANIWNDISFIATATSTSDYFILRMLDADTNGMSLEVKYAMVLDLTAIFGAGNEPTKEFMDYLMTLKYGTNAWFDGTSEIFNLADAVKLFASTQQEAWITPTLSNATSTYITYRKDELSYVDTVGVIVVSVLGTNYTYASGYRPLTTLYVPMVKSDGTFAYAIVNTDGTFVTNATGTFYVNFRFPTV